MRTGSMTGRLSDIASRVRAGQPMQEVSDGEITLQGGLVGDFKGAKYARRQITVLALAQHAVQGGRHLDQLGESASFKFVL